MGVIMLFARVASYSFNASLAKVHPQVFLDVQRADWANAHLHRPGALPRRLPRNQHLPRHQPHLHRRYPHPHSGLNLANCHIFYLDFERKLYVHLGLFPFKQELYLKYELFLDASIKMRFRSIAGQKKGEPAPGLPDHSAPLQKKKKVKERTIREARDSVAEWRWLYEQVDAKGKRIHTLDSAANKVGLAKKTLDDYLYQMRQGEYYGFKFQENEHEKIGVLRRFVRLSMERENSMMG
jgi:hypothetical protein